jgi:hypothetical protein
MKDHFQFRSRLTTSREILSHQTPFLPVRLVRLPEAGEIYTPEMQHFMGLLPVLNFKRKNLSMAQPLLKEESR